MSQLFDQMRGDDIHYPPGYEHLQPTDDETLEGGRFKVGKFLKKHVTQKNIDKALGAASQLAAFSGDPRAMAVADTANSVNSTQKMVRGKGLSIAGRGARKSMLADVLESAM